VTDTAASDGEPSARERTDATASGNAGVDAATARVDPHVKVLDEDVVARAKARGLDVVVYAPHFTRLPEIRERAARFSDDDLLVVPGREVFTGNWRHRRHILAIGLTDPVPDFITLDGALAAFAAQEAAVLVPHPEFLNVSLTAEEIAANRDRIHAVETHNFKALPRQNRRARSVVVDSDLPAFGSSYAHLRGSVGEVWTTFDRRIESESDLVDALRDGAPRRVYHRGGAAHRTRGLAEFAHLGYENSWKKIDRLFLSGTEPTHPDHVAYGGEFDAVSEY
jgi:predicted metal-dependent phosphoesterase TrpH